MRVLLNPLRACCLAALCVTGAASANAGSLIEDSLVTETLVLAPEAVPQPPQRPVVAQKPVVSQRKIKAVQAARRLARVHSRPAPVLVTASVEPARIKPLAPVAQLTNFWLTVGTGF